MPELAPLWLRVAIAIAAYIGMRESDVARVTSKKYDGREFETGQVKTGEPIWVAAHYRLREILDTIASVLGQQTAQMAEHYSRTARRHRLATAAIEWIEERDWNGLENGMGNVPLSHWKGTEP